MRAVSPPSRSGGSISWAIPSVLSHPPVANSSEITSTHVLMPQQESNGTQDYDRRDDSKCCGHRHSKQSIDDSLAAQLAACKMPFWRVCARGPMTLHLRESTIHEQFDSRDVAAIVGCEKHDGFSSLIGRSEPSERNALGDHLFAFLAYL